MNYRLFYTIRGETYSAEYATYQGAMAGKAWRKEEGARKLRVERITR